MSKYKLGDRFIVTITDVDDGGMGTLYRLDGGIMMTDYELDKLETVEIAPLSDKYEDTTSEPKTYTPDDLLSRILYLCQLLNDTTQKYCDMKGMLEEGVPNLDKLIKDMSL